MELQKVVYWATFLKEWIHKNILGFGFFFLQNSPLPIPRQNSNSLLLTLFLERKVGCKPHFWFATMVIWMLSIINQLSHKQCWKPILYSLYTYNHDNINWYQINFLFVFVWICVRFLVEAAALLETHIDTEGLFRKSGSVARQKELKVSAIIKVWLCSLIEGAQGECYH